MPRKSRAEVDPNVEQRVTRRSVRSCVVDSPKKKEPSPAPTPNRGKGKGRAASASSPRGRGKKVQSEDEDEEHEEIESTPTKVKKGRKASASPRGKKTSGRGKSKKEESDEDDDDDMEEEKEKKTPTKSPRTRSPRAAKAAPSETPSPTRKSSRGAAKAAAEKIESQAADKDEEKEEEEEASPSKGTKRKAEDEVSSSEEKRVKVDEKTEENAPPEGDEPVEGEEAKAKSEENVDMEESKEVAQPEKDEESKMETDEKSEPLKEESEKPAEKEQEKEPETMEITSSEPEEKQNIDSVMGKDDTVESSQTSERETKEEGSTGEDTEPVTETDVPAQSTEEDEKAEDAVMEADTTGNDNKAPETDVIVPEKDGDSKEEEREEEEEKPSEEQKDNADSSAQVEEQKADGEENENFEFVNAEDIPSHDSKEVQDILPSMNAQHQNKIQEPIDQLNGKEKISNISEVESINPSASASKTVSNENQELHDPLFSRKFLTNPNLPQDGTALIKDRQFSIVSYNILADCHALNGIRDWEQYTWTTEEKLAMKHRKIRLHQELEYLDADVFCLQEVDPTYFHDELLPFFVSRGYQGFFIKRVGDHMKEGEASFYRTSRFSLVRSQGYVLHELAEKEMKALNISEEKQQQILRRINSPAVFLIMQLKCTKTDTVITIGNIHVEWGHLKSPDVQCVQIGCAIKELVSQAGGTDKPHIICGDFNSTTTTPGYQLARNGYLSDEAVTTLQHLKEVDLPEGKKGAVIDLWWKGFQHTSDSLRSSYFTVQGSEPLTSKFPHDGGIRGVDYMWFSSSTLNLHGVLDVIPSILIVKGIPNEVIPSDHLSLKAAFSYK